MRLRISIVMTVALLLGSACAAGDIDLDVVLDELGTTDLSDSDDTGVQAAGETVVEILSVREAEENLARGIAERDRAAIQQASRLRPEDPKYPMHELVLTEIGGSTIGEQKQVANRAIMLVWGQNPDMSISEVKRVAGEMYLDALRDVIKSAPEFEGRAVGVAAYCKAIEKEYPEMHTERFPQDVALYLAVSADFTLC